MRTISLNGSWELRIPESTFPVVSATVPGSVYNDLLANNLMDNPFYRDNEDQALALMEHDFIYSRSFTVDVATLASDAVLLHCDGLDTLAEIILNGQQAGKADNMHRIWEYDVKNLLHVGENTIEIRFASPTKAIRGREPLRTFTCSISGFSYVRKTHCMYGWDWGPVLPDAGIWRDISVIGIRTARIRPVLGHGLNPWLGN